MGRENPRDREARLRSWWNRLSPDQQHAEIRAGHVRVNLPRLPERSELTPNQRKAARRRARGK